MFWLPKLHIYPTRSRFIIAALKCSVKRLHKTFTSILGYSLKKIKLTVMNARFSLV